MLTEFLVGSPLAKGSMCVDDQLSFLAQLHRGNPLSRVETASMPSHCSFCHQVAVAWHRRWLCHTGRFNESLDDNEMPGPWLAAALAELDTAARPEPMNKKEAHLGHRGETSRNFDIMLNPYLFVITREYMKLHAWLHRGVAVEQRNEIPSSWKALFLQLGRWKFDAYAFARLARVICEFWSVLDSSGQERQHGNALPST